MNNNQSSEEEIITLLQSQEVRPSEALLHSTLSKIPSKANVKSPYTSLFQKIALGSLAVIILISGGLLYHHNANNDSSTLAQATESTTTISQSDSNSALDQDMNAIDTEMNGLQSDTANADKALNS